MRPQVDRQMLQKPGRILLNSKSIASLISDVCEKKSGFRFKARGWSMSPFIKDGDILTLLPPNTGILALGDVIGYVHQASGKLIVHRIVNRWTQNIKNKQYLIKGDNSITDDGVVQETSVLGYVDRVERNGKSVEFGLGWEKKVIALLSRMGLLRYIGYCYKKLHYFFE